MQLNGLSIVLWCVSLFLAGIEVPRLHVSVRGADISDLVISQVNISRLNATLDSSRWSISTASPSVLSASVFIRKGKLISTRAHLNVNIEPLNVSIIKSSDDGYLTSTVTVDKCIFDSSVSLTTEPYSFPLAVAWPFVKGKTRKQIKAFVCDTFLPLLASEMQNHTVNPPSVTPPLVPGATPLGHSRLAVALVNVINNIPSILGVSFAASIDANTALRMGLHFPNGLHFPPEGLLESIPDPDVLLKDLMMLVENLGLANYLDEYMSLVSGILPQVSGGFLGVHAPSSVDFSLKAALHDLRCEAGSLRCSVPYSDGITVQEVRTHNLEDFDRLVVNHVSPLAAPVVGAVMNRVIALFAKATADGRLELPTINETPSGTVPSTVVLVLMVVVSFILLVGAAVLSVWRHRRSPVTKLDGTPVSLSHVLVEDMFLISMAVLAAFGFTWSNTTIGATLVVGKEINVLSFSLWESTCNMYEANVRLFAVLIFFFSGVYPYVKLTVIVLCTLVFQKPNHIVLHVVDYFGKFSLLDSFGMLTMAGGLQLKGVAEVRILTGFYLFMIATILSMFLGNYATWWWRLGTSVRGHVASSEPVGEHETNSERDGAEDPQRAKGPKHSLANNGESGEPCAGYLWTKKRIVLHVLHGLFVLALVVPAWVAPCLGYRVTGVSRLIQPEDRRLTLFDLAKMNALFLVTSAFTLGIAPVLYGIMFPRWSFLATWCASDAFLLACVAGLLQVNRFVRFVLGENMDSLYATDAYLMWPLILLLILSIWQWILAAESTFHLTRRFKKCLAALKNSVSQ